MWLNTYDLTIFVLNLAPRLKFGWAQFLTLSLYTLGLQFPIQIDSKQDSYYSPSRITQRNNKFYKLSSISLLHWAQQSYCSTRKNTYLVPTNHLYLSKDNNTRSFPKYPSTLRVECHQDPLNLQSNEHIGSSKVPPKSHQDMDFRKKD